jgi:Leucine-rich repeat (LRR) protein
MIQEKLYIRLLQKERILPEEIPKEFLRDFQFCKIALEKLEIGNFSESQQREMHLEAVEFYLNSPKTIALLYDIPEIVRLVPENFLGHLSLDNSQIRELPQLKSVAGCLNLQYSQIKGLPNLKSVGGCLSLLDSKIEELPLLEAVGIDLGLDNSQIRELPRLEIVWGDIFIGKHLYDYWRNYFAKVNKPHLKAKVQFVF